MKIFCIMFGFILILIPVSQCYSEELGPISRETVTGRMEARNAFAWRYGYDIELKDSTVFVHVAINLIPAGGATRPELDRVSLAWEAGIERIWSERFSLVTSSGKRYPIVVDISFKGPRFHHEVIVRPGGGHTDELNWNLLNSPEIAAHEFGHMVGVFDEYRRGAIAQRGAVIDNMSIMTSNPNGGITYSRHYEGFRAWFVSKTGLGDVSLVSIR